MNRKRPKQIVIRLSEQEFEDLKIKVEQSGKNQQQYIIEALTKKRVVNTDGLKEVAGELKNGTPHSRYFSDELGVPNF